MELEKARDSDLNETVAPEPIAEFALLGMHEDVTLGRPSPRCAQTARDARAESLCPAAHVDHAACGRFGTRSIVGTPPRPYEKVTIEPRRSFPAALVVREFSENGEISGSERQRQLASNGE